MNKLFDRNDNIYRSFKPVKHGTMSGIHFGNDNKTSDNENIKLVFLHANGFNGLCYRSILEPLGVHCLSLDLRGHGLTELPAKINDFASFHTYAQDVVDYLRRHIKGKVVLAGHSLGASTAILAAHKAPDKIERVLALDPIVLAFHLRLPMMFTLSRKHLQKHYPLARSASRRRALFESRQAAYERYHGRKPFHNFSDNALWDYVCGGFVETGNETEVCLACKPEWEQFTYTAQSQNMERPIARLPAGSHVIMTNFTRETIGRDRDPKLPTRWSQKIQQKRPDLVFEHRADLDHFFPMTNPSLTIAALKDILNIHEN